MGMLLPAVHQNAVLMFVPTAPRYYSTDSQGICVQFVSPKLTILLILMIKECNVMLCYVLIAPATSRADEKEPRGSAQRVGREEASIWGGEGELGNSATSTGTAEFFQVLSTINVCMNLEDPQFPCSFSEIHSSHKSCFRPKWAWAFQMQGEEAPQHFIGPSTWKL